MMPSSTAIFSSSYTFIDDKLRVFLDDRLGSIMHEVATPLRLATVLYIALYGIAIIRGSIAEPLMDFTVRSLKLCFTSALATTNAYTENITSPLFVGLPNALARAISGSETTNVGAAFDQFFAYGAALAAKISNGVTAVDLPSHLISCVVIVVSALAAALGFGVLTVAKVALALLVALGPIFIACALFEASRRFFFGWVSQAVNYVVLFALIVAVFELVLALVAAQWPTIDGETNLKSAGMVFSALCLLGAIFFLQVPNIATGIAGGASTGVADFFAAANFVTRQRRAATGSDARAAAPPARAGGSIRTVGGRS